MAVIYTSALRTTRMTATRDACAGGALQLHDAGGNVLSSHTLSSSGGTVADGIWTLAFADATAAATASGTATAARIRSSSNADVATGWPAIMARVAASDAPDRAVIRAAVPIRARLAAGDAPDSARLSVAVRIGAVLDTADAPDMARIIMRLWSQSSRYAYPGDPQGGVVGPSARSGVLAPSTRSGTITRP